MTFIHLATWLLLGRYTAAAPGATEFLGEALAAYAKPTQPAPQGSTVILFLATLLKLLVVLALIIGTIWVLRKFFGTGGLVTADSGPVRVLAVRHLDARHAVWLLEVGERILVIGTGGGGMAALASIESPVERAAIRERLGPGGEKFGSYLSAWAARMGGGESAGGLREGRGFLSERIARMKEKRSGGPDDPPREPGMGAPPR